jgi:hypothetical protein
MPPPSEPDALAALRERLERTQQAAQKLAEDAARERDAARAGDKPPPNGWDVPHSAETAGTEVDALVALLTTMRDVLPPELRAQLAELARQILVFVRAVLDWWIGRLEQGPQDPPAPRGDVEDIPIS